MNRAALYLIRFAILFCIAGFFATPYGRTKFEQLKNLVIGRGAAANPEPASETAAETEATPTPAPSAEPVVEKLGAGAPAAAPRSTPPMLRIALKNGQSVTGRVIIENSDTTIVRQADGKTKEISTREISYRLPAE